MSLWTLRGSVQLTQKFESFSKLCKSLDYVKGDWMSKENCLSCEISSTSCLPTRQKYKISFFHDIYIRRFLVPTRTRCVLGQGKRVIKAMENSFKMVQVNFGVRSDRLLFYASLNTAFWNCQVLEVFLRYKFF